MSKTLLTRKDVPKYVQEIVTRLCLTTDYTEQDLPGYTFKLYGKWRVGYENQLRGDCQKLIDWCRSYFADAYIVSEHFWMTDVPHESNGFAGDKHHKQKAYRQGYRNYIKIVITDPVANRFEKDKYYRGE